MKFNYAADIAILSLLKKQFSQVENITGEATAIRIIYFPSPTFTFIWFVIKLLETHASMSCAMIYLEETNLAETSLSQRTNVAGQRTENAS